MASVRNPVDMIATATPENYRTVVRTILESNEVDALIAIYLFVGGAPTESVTQAIQDGMAAIPLRPVLLCCLPDDTSTKLTGSGPVKLPCYPHPETSATILGKMAAYAEWRNGPIGTNPSFTDVDAPRARAICRNAAKQRGETWLNAEETRDVLQAMRLPVAPGGVARSADEAAALALGLGFPVAVKLVSTTLVHKTELGGVRLNVADEAGVRTAFEEIQSKLRRRAIWMPWKACWSNPW